MRPVDKLDPSPDRRRSLRIMAKSIFREMLAKGYDPQHVISLSSELLDLVTSEVRANGAR